MNYLLCMFGATLLTIFGVSLFFNNEPAVSPPVEAPAPKNIVIEEDGYQYYVYRDEKTGLRIFVTMHGGAVILEKPIPLEGH